MSSHIIPTIQYYSRASISQHPYPLKHLLTATSSTTTEAPHIPYGPSLYSVNPLQHLLNRASPSFTMPYSSSKKPATSSPRVYSSSSDTYGTSSRSSSSRDYYYTSRSSSNSKKSSKEAPILVHYSSSDSRSKTYDKPRTKHQDPRYY